MVQPRLTDALTNRKVDVAKDMLGILIRIGRFKSLELHYMKVHLKSIKKLWEEYEVRQQASKLANEKNEVEKILSSHDSQSNSTRFSFSSCFHDELLLYLEQAWKWCMLAFPEDCRALVPKLLTETMTAIGQSFVSRINLATGMLFPRQKHCQKVS